MSVRFSVTLPLSIFVISMLSAIVFLTISWHLSSSSTMVKYIKALTIPPRIHPMVTKLKAAFLSPKAVTNTEIKKGPAPLPISSVVLRRANAVFEGVGGGEGQSLVTLALCAKPSTVSSPLPVPLCSGRVTFWRTALTLGPVMLAQKPAQMAKKLAIAKLLSADTPLRR